MQTMTLTTREPVPEFGEDDLWSAVVHRDRQADGRFVYGVRTTGVYCRPSCPSRTARRENVTFHASGEDAERAGYRPCKRCKPDEPGLAERQAALVVRACRLVAASEDALSPAGLAEAVGMSRFHFHRVFKSVTGLTPKAYIAAERAKRIRGQLSSGATVTSAIYDAGFNSNGRFYATSSEILGMTASSYRAGGRDAQIRFAVGQCSLGAILVGATEKGVCAILLGEDAQRLVEQLQDQFPQAELIGADIEFEKTVARVVGFIEAPGVGLDLPLDLRGTAFQQRVWQALRQIPVGATTSYSAIAQAIGAPKAARAVALACAANPIAVAVPCHRVVRQDGALSGYRWGVERKSALLKRESAS
ncbi:MAG: bifunctional DNA-binding transcriptional regulator/O6-methylguanine-DNA methyltransferase Ada [Burkholderiaceae bacterium]|jgi:AraC family transcriptional regulator of adaptative response/methylated-DNA-[protein]-cysteine methyltransferase